MSTCYDGYMMNNNNVPEPKGGGGSVGQMGDNQTIRASIIFIHQN